MKKILLSLRAWIVHQKIHFTRGYGYFGFLGMGYLVSSKLKEQLREMGIDIPLSMVAPIALGFVWLLGYMDLRLGFFHDEISHQSKHSPAYGAVIKMLKRILNKIEDKK